MAKNVFKLIEEVVESFALLEETDLASSPGLGAMGRWVGVDSPGSGAFWPCFPIPKPDGVGVSKLDGVLRLDLSRMTIINTNYYHYYEFKLHSSYKYHILNIPCKRGVAPNEYFEYSSLNM